jgi:hypothetical protein
VHLFASALPLAPFGPCLEVSSESLRWLAELTQPVDGTDGGSRESTGGSSARMRWIPGGCHRRLVVRVVVIHPHTGRPPGRLIRADHRPDGGRVRPGASARPRRGAVLLHEVCILVDTGSFNSEVSTNVAAALKLATLKKRTKVSGVGCQAKAAQVKTRTWSLSGAHCRPKRSPVSNSPRVSDLPGSDQLSHFESIVIDYASGKLLILRSGVCRQRRSCSYWALTHSMSQSARPIDLPPPWIRRSKDVANPVDRMKDRLSARMKFFAKLRKVHLDKMIAVPMRIVVSFPALAEKNPLGNNLAYVF